MIENQRDGEKFVELNGQRLPILVAKLLASHHAIDTPLAEAVRYADAPVEPVGKSEITRGLREGESVGLPTTLSLQDRLKDLESNLWDQVYDAAFSETGDIKVQDEELNRQYVLALANLARVEGNAKEATRLTEIFKVI